MTSDQAQRLQAFVPAVADHQMVVQGDAEGLGGGMELQRPFSTSRAYTGAWATMPVCRFSSRISLFLRSTYRT